MTVAEWVRQALRVARRQDAPLSTDRKIQALREAMRHVFPSGRIDEMLADIERGYGDGST